jgi:transposase-like protein/IS1 family transposase
MNCIECNNLTKKFGKDRKGNQRFQCLTCKKTFIEPQEKPLGDMRLPMEKALMILKLLVEGNSIRSTMRITDVDKNTILSLLVFVGTNCEKMLEEVVKNVSVKNVQCDEIWGFVSMKEKTRKAQGRKDEDGIGDAYCFVGMDSDTKLILAWHLGRRTTVDTVAFTEKLCNATADHNFQINTDGFAAYKDAIVYSLGGKKIDFAQVIKVFGKPEGEERRYSPSEVIGTEKFPVFGNPDLDKATTSHIERQNLTIRMSMRRMTRLTNAFSKKHENLRCAYALHFAYYNFCRIHSSLRITPAMEAKLTPRVWSLKELLEISGAYGE